MVVFIGQYAQPRAKSRSFLMRLVVVGDYILYRTNQGSLTKMKFPNNRAHGPFTSTIWRHPSSILRLACVGHMCGHFDVYYQASVCVIGEILVFQTKKIADEVALCNG